MGEAEFERAVVATLLDNQRRIVPFSHDPLQRLRPLAEERLPTSPKEGTFEIEVTPEHNPHTAQTAPLSARSSCRCTEGTVSPLSNRPAALGVPFEDVGTIGGAGAVNVIYGSVSGLSSTGDQFWHQNSPGIVGGAEPGDVFGEVVVQGRIP